MSEPIEPCPPWCVEPHDESDMPADRRHIAEGMTFAMVGLHRQKIKGDKITREIIASECLIEQYQYFDESDVWIAISDEVQYITMSRESITRLRDGLNRLLAN